MKRPFHFWLSNHFLLLIGLRICCRQQSNAYNKLRRKAGTKPLGGQGSRVLDIPVDGPRKLDNLRRKGHDHQGHLRFHRERYQEVWVGSSALSSRVESLFFGTRSILYEEVQVVHAEDARVFELSKAWFRNQGHIHPVTSVIRIALMQSWPRTSILQLQWPLFQGWQRLPEGSTRRRDDHKKHIPQCIDGSNSSVLARRSKTTRKDTQMDRYGTIRS